jgi:hypothetical protein
MDEVGTTGLDIAKSVFQVHGADAAGAVVIRASELECRPQSRIERARPRRADRTRVGERRAAVGEIGHIAGFEERAVSRVAVVKEVIDAAVDLEGLVDLVGSVDIGHGIGRQF